MGLLTDGAVWECYHAKGGSLDLVTSIRVTPSSPNIDAFLVWLEGVLATTKAIAPTTKEIETRLGAQSSSHSLDKSSLLALYTANRAHPSVALKRTLWARLLTSALGTQFEDSDDLFVEHTLLVNSAEIIAHALLGLQVALLSPASLLSGTKFDESGIHGVVERDLFDWVIEVKNGDGLAFHLAAQHRFSVAGFREQQLRDPESIGQACAGQDRDSVGRLCR